MAKGSSIGLIKEKSGGDGLGGRELYVCIIGDVTRCFFVVLERLRLLVACFVACRVCV
jgi:hypothetical protein